MEKILYLENQINEKNICNFEIVEFGFQPADPSHHQGPYFKTAHIFQYMLSGHGYLEINGETFEVHQGDLFYLPKNILLSYHSDPDNPYTYYWLGINYLSSLPLVYNTGLSPSHPVLHIPDRYIRQLFENMDNSFSKNSEAEYLYAKGLAFQFFSYLISKNTSKPNISLIPAKYYVTSALHFIHNHFNEDISVQSVADYIGIGRSYFSTIFFRYTSVSPIHYLVRYRIEQSKKMLQQGISVTDAALLCGFNSPAHFSVQFKKITGISPRNFQKT